VSWTGKYRHLVHMSIGWPPQEGMYATGPP
jgi:hypothetical protein